MTEKQKFIETLKSTNLFTITPLKQNRICLFGFEWFKVDEYVYRARRKGLAIYEVIADLKGGYNRPDGIDRFGEGETLSEAYKWATEWCEYVFDKYGTRTERQAKRRTT